MAQRSRSAAPYEVRTNGVLTSSHWSEKAAWAAWERRVRDDNTLVCTLTRWIPPMYDKEELLGDHKADGGE